MTAIDALSFLVAMFAHSKSSAELPFSSSVLQLLLTCFCFLLSSQRFFIMHSMVGKSKISVAGN